MISPSQIKLICTAIVCIISSLSALADRGPKHVDNTRKVTLHYTFDSAKINENFKENEKQLFLLANTLNEAVKIDSITIISYSSPEGSHHHNARLAQERGAVLKEFLLKEYGDSLRLSSERILLKPVAENWEGLTEMACSLYTRHDRDKVLRILRDTGIGDETRKWRLGQLDGGYTWDFMVRHYMPQLRTSTVICIWTSEAPAEPETPIVTEEDPEPTTTPEPEQEPVPEVLLDPATPPQVPVLALRSNLLVPLLNIGAEIPLGNRWSLGADYYFPWIWPSEKNKDCFELLGWSVEGRYWFGRNRTSAQRLQGHSLALYGAGGYYDFERNYKGQQGEFVSAGLDYTYAMPVGRAKRVNLEFTIAVGYLHSWGRNYNVPGPGAPLFREEGDVLFDYFGPTKAAISIVVPFYRKEGRK